MLLVTAALTLFSTGCGTTNSRRGTQQLILSDAIDRSIARIDFTPLRGRKVFFDAQYIQTVKGEGFVNAEYVVSSLRQQIAASGCLLQETADDADIIIEGRMGALGADDHDLTFGIPPSSALSTAASMVASAPPIPILPEVSLAKRYDQAAAAKVAAFAYHRVTREPVWQSGVRSSESSARDLWVLGAGPFRRGTAYEGLHFASEKIKAPLVGKGEPGLGLYSEASVFQPDIEHRDSDVVLAGYAAEAEPIEVKGKKAE